MCQFLLGTVQPGISYSQEKTLRVNSSQVRYNNLLGNRLVIWLNGVNSSQVRYNFHIKITVLHRRIYCVNSSQVRYNRGVRGSTSWRKYDCVNSSQVRYNIYNSRRQHYGQKCQFLLGTVQRKIGQIFFLDEQNVFCVNSSQVRYN